MTSSEIRKSLNIEPLLLRIEKSQLKWFGNVSKILRKDSPNKLYFPKQTGEDQLDDLELDEPNYIEDLGWNRLGLHPSEMCGGIISSCCLRNPHEKASNEERKEKELNNKNRRNRVCFVTRQRRLCHKLLTSYRM